MGRRNVFVRSLFTLARKFRSLQEIWILPWWGSGGITTVPLWAVDILVLIVKLWSTCAVAAVRVLIPPAMKSLYGETVLITGAGQGIGRELAIQFADLGATVVCWDSDARRSNAVANEISKKDGDCYSYTVDITAREQVAGLAARMRRQFTDVTMVVSNAGAVTCAPLIHLRPEGVSKLVEVNLLAHFWVLQAFLPGMIERRHGHIVAINSSAGLMPWADMAPYCAAKFGLRGLMDSLSEELRLDTWTKNIHTTSVYLGTVSTGLYPPPNHRFTSCYSEITAKEAARLIIEGIRKNKRNISVPSFMRFLILLNGLLPYRIRIILTDFFNFRHRVESMALTKMDGLTITQRIKIIKKQQAVDGDFSKKNFFSDEAHFSLGGYVNKQSCRIWGSENPQVIEERPLHPEKVTVWCALWSEGVIGPYFFENDDGTTVTVNSERYGLDNRLFFEENMWFQQETLLLKPQNG